MMVSTIDIRRAAFQGQLDPAPYLKRLLLVGVEVVAVDQMGARDRAECTAMVVVGQVLDTNPLPPDYSTGMW